MYRVEDSENKKMDKKGKKWYWSVNKKRPTFVLCECAKAKSCTFSHGIFIEKILPTASESAFLAKFTKLYHRTTKKTYRLKTGF